LTGRRPQKKTRKGRTRKRGTHQKKATFSVAFRWVVSILFLVLACMLGVLLWARTPPGRAALLRIGADKFYSEVQSNIGEAVSTTLNGFQTGPARLLDPSLGETPLDFDWSVNWIAPGAAIHCRQVPVPEGQSFWEVQHTLAAAIQPVGGKVLWGERLARTNKVRTDTGLDRADDLLRLDHIAH